MVQLFSTKVSVCKTAIFYSRVGVKQGGVMSGILFSSCYDDLVEDLEKTGVRILFSCVNNKYKLICVIIYADDIFLISASPTDLKNLIEKAFKFAKRYNDIESN